MAPSGTGSCHVCEGVPQRLNEMGTDTEFGGSWSPDATSIPLPASVRKINGACSHQRGECGAADHRPSRMCFGSLSGLVSLLTTGFHFGDESGWNLTLA